MARRRKKESSRKRSLLFEQSPTETEQCRRLLSPVLCVDHPITALSVPVDDTNITWVSPQFNGISISHGKRRQARRRRQSTSNRLHGATVNKENSHINRSRVTTGRKFPALHFVGDPAKPSLKQLHGNDPAAKLMFAHCNDEGESLSMPDRSRGRRAQHNFAPNKDREEDYACPETVRKRRSSYRKSLYHGHRLSLAPSSSFCSDNSNTSFPSPDLAIMAIKRRTSRGARQGPACLQTSQNETHSGEGEAGASSSGKRRKETNRKSYDSDILLSPLETSNLSGVDGHSTPVFIGIKEQMPLRVALFAPSPSEEPFLNNSGSSSCPQGSSRSQKGGASLDFDMPSSDGRDNLGGKRTLRVRSKETSILSPDGSRRTSISSQRKHSQNFQLTGQGSTPRRSRRLREKYADALKYLQPGTPTSKEMSAMCERETLHVLVQDTPESEYGLTLRQRQQMKLKPKT